MIACSLLFINIMDVLLGGDADYVQNHIFSAMIIIPFIASSLALFDFNCYPARVFVGDTFTYSAGVTFAAVSLKRLLSSLGGYLWTFQQISSVVLHSSTCELHHFSPSTLWTRSLSTSSTPKVLLRIICYVELILRLVCYNPV